MARARKVVLIGNSLVAASLASTLKSRPELEVLLLDAEAPEAARRLRDARPDVVLYELMTTPPDLVFALLGECPGLSVIAVDMDGDRLVVLSGRQASLRTKDDLLEAIRQQPLLSPLWWARVAGQRRER